MTETPAEYIVNPPAVAFPVTPHEYNEMHDEWLSDPALTYQRGRALDTAMALYRALDACDNEPSLAATTALDEAERLFMDAAAQLDAMVRARKTAA